MNKRLALTMKPFRRVRNLANKILSTIGITAIRPTVAPQNEKANEKPKSLKLSFKEIPPTKSQSANVNL